MAQKTNKAQKVAKVEDVKAKQRFVASGKGLKIEPPKKNKK